MALQSYQDLKAWQKSIDLVHAVYQISSRWPGHELYGLTSQARRAAVSIPANIAEGQGRRSTLDFRRHIGIAYGSLLELETHLIIAARLGYISEVQLSALREQSAEVGRIINGLDRSLEQRT